MPAREIVQDFIDVMATATLAGDWDTYSAHVSLPFELITASARMIVSSDEDLRQGFDQFHEMLKSQRVTEYIRLVDTARQDTPLIVTGSYTSHFMAGSHRILPPMHSQITLRLDGNLWRALSITTEMTNARWPILVPRLAQDTSPKGADE